MIDSTPDVPEVPEPGNGDPDEAPPRTTGIADGNLLEPMELNSFMQGLGFVFQLPTRSKARVRATNVEHGDAALARPRTRWALVTFALVVGAAVFFGLQGRARDRLPLGARGQWVTADPRYANRAFDLDSGEVAFHTGAGAAALTRHAISALTVRPDGKRKRVTLTYEADGAPMELAFWFESDTASIIRFVHQPDIVWTRPADRAP